jgi:hypothetical protein
MASTAKRIIRNSNDRVESRLTALFREELDRVFSSIEYQALSPALRREVHDSLKKAYSYSVTSSSDSNQDEDFVSVSRDVKAGLANPPSLSSWFH